jgi:hypothetical protein
MKEFTSFAGFGAELILLAAELPLVEHELLEDACRKIEKRAKDKIGEYQSEAGQFAAWAPLAESTQEDRARQGFPEDEPLLRTGQMRDSIEHRVTGHEGHVGSDSDIALYQELGTLKIPARSFLGGAAFELTPEILEETGVEMTAFLSGGHRKVAIR